MTLLLNQSRYDYGFWNRLRPYPYCLSASNSTSFIMLSGRKGFINVYDFNSKKEEENHPGIQEFTHLQSPDYDDNSYGCSSAITFNKEAKQKIIVLISEFCKFAAHKMFHDKRFFFFYLTNHNKCFDKQLSINLARTGLFQMLF